MKADRVDEIIDPEFKSGTSEKNGRQFTWRLVKIRVGDKEATGFGPVVEGDPVRLSYNSQYNNWKFEVLSGDDLPTINVDDDSGSQVGVIDESRQSSVAIKEPKPSAAAEPRDNREYQVTRNMVWKNLLGHVGAPTTDAEIKTFMKLVDKHTTYLMGGVVESPKAALNPTTGKDSWAETGEALRNKRKMTTEEDNEFLGGLDEEEHE